MKKKIISTALSIAMAASLAGCAAAPEEQGFCDAISESGRVSQIYTVNCVSTEESAYEGTTELLTEHPEINTIAALNEFMSLGSGYAVRDLGVEAAYNVVNGHPLHSDHIDTTTTYVSVSNMYEPDIQRMIFRFDEPS